MYESNRAIDNTDNRTSNEDMPASSVSGSSPKSRIIPRVVLDNRFFPSLRRVDFDSAKRHVDTPRDKCPLVRDDGKASNSVSLLAVHIQDPF